MMYYLHIQNVEYLDKEQLEYVSKILQKKLYSKFKWSLLWNQENTVQNFLIQITRH